MWKSNQSCHIIEQKSKQSYLSTCQMSPLKSHSLLSSMLFHAVIIFSPCSTLHALQNNGNKCSRLINDRPDNVCKKTLWSFLLSGGAGFPHLTADRTLITSTGKERVERFHDYRHCLTCNHVSHAFAATWARRGAWVWLVCQRRSPCCCPPQTTATTPLSGRRSPRWPGHRMWSVQTQLSLLLSSACPANFLLLPKHTWISTSQ